VDGGVMDEVWILNILMSGRWSHQGIREKYYGEDWAPPSHDLSEPKHVVEAKRRSRSGYPITREEMTEAVYVWSPSHWKKVKDLFFAGIFLAVKGRLAERLKEFDLGEGGLVEFPIYEADKVTPVKGPFYMLNFGGPKDTFLPLQSKNVSFFMTRKSDGAEVWNDNMGITDGDIAVTREALSGADLWVEKRLHDNIFMTGQLHDAILKAEPRIKYRFARVRVID
jgi:hypothetical protein